MGKKAMAMFEYFHGECVSVKEKFEELRENIYFLSTLEEALREKGVDGVDEIPFDLPYIYKYLLCFDKIEAIAFEYAHTNKEFRIGIRIVPKSDFPELQEK